MSNKETVVKKEEEFISAFPSACCASCASKQTQSHKHEDEHDHHHHDHEHEHGHDHEHHEPMNLKIFLARLVLSFLIVVLLEFTSYLDFALYLFYAIAYLLAGAEVVYMASRNLLKGHLFDENFLMTIASIGAFALGERSEAVAVMIFYGIGELLQSAAVARSRKNITQLMDIRPDVAHIKTNEGTISLSPEEVELDSILIVRPGEKVALDGEVIKGSSFMDTSALTGESVPRRASIGDIILSGSLNQNGLLEVRVTKTYKNSTVAKILDLVQHASSKKAKSEKFITKFARYYTPAVVCGSVLVAVLPPLLGFGTFSEWIYKALTFLIISCPCALVLSIPISFFGGIGGAARNGILIKGGNYLETLYSVKNIVLDKTGTLTKGVFNVQEIYALHSSEQELLSLAASAEAHSTHPIAKSILKAYSERLAQSSPFIPATNIQEIAGQGIIAQIENDEIHIGNAKLLASIGIEDLPAFTQTVVYIAKNKVYQGYILIADEVKENLTIALKNIRNTGIEKLIMLTGDNKNIAEDFAKNYDLDEVYAGLLPQDKVSKLEDIMKHSQGKTAFVGDGINDAPVLSRADIGFAMGGIGSDAAIEAADIVLMNDDIEKLATACKIAKKTRQIVVQNIVFCLGIKGIIMLLAIYGLTSIWFAIFADVGVALLAVMNAMRAMFVK